MPINATALIAEDEPLLAANLQAELGRLWPELRIVANVGDGRSAVEQALALEPDLLFLDIRMPAMTGLEAAQALAEDWPDAGKPFPLLVFVTAYDQYALDAFEHAALDYVLKPVETTRLEKTCTRLQAELRQRAGAPSADPVWATVVDQLRGLLGAAAFGLPPAGAGTAPAAGAATAGPLKMIQASAGNTITLVPVDDVLYFEAADKYVRVVTPARDHLIRLSLRELQLQLDPHRFWQIHRGTIVRSDAIACAVRDEAGKLTLTLRGHSATLRVSRLYADLFKGM
jgi:DNA-binding LytR/AlgR family response regulator